MSKRRYYEVDDSQIIHLGKFHNYRGRMPVAEVVTNEGDVVGYLSPFRFYAFQVSATLDGAGDLGSSRVFGITNITRSVTTGHAPSNLNWAETVVELLKGQAMIALAKFAGQHGYVLEANRRYSGNMVCGYKPKAWFEEMDGFIWDTIMMVDPDSVPESTREFYLQKVDEAVGQ